MTRSTLFSLALILAAGVLLLPAASFSEPSVKARGSSAPGASDLGRPAASATRMLRVVVTKVENGGVVLHMRNEADDSQEIVVRIPETLRIRAQDKKAFDGRKKLNITDLQVGQRLRVTVLPSEQRIVSLVVLKPKARKSRAT